MKWLLLILFFISCSIEKPVQVKVTYLKVEKIDGDWVTWVDSEGVRFYMKYTYPLKVGDQMPFLITR